MKIALDAGHGNWNVKERYDSGAVAIHNGIKFEEASIALQWVLTGKHILAKHGIKTFLLRDDDTDIVPVRSRASRAKNAGCTHFISFHCNSANGVANGTETYYETSADKVLAKIVQDCAIATMGLRNRGVKLPSESQHTRLAISAFPNPFCLLELGFIDSPKDIVKITDRDNRIEFFEKLSVNLKENYL
jgi:N-acetylmuramoyl-L-alanine amidase